MSDSNPADGDAGPLRAGADIEGADLADLDVAGRDLRDMRVVECTMSGTKLRGADLSSTELDHVRFESCDLVGTIWDGSRFEAVEFVDCNLTGIDWTRANWSSLSLPAPVAFRRSRLDLSTFQGLGLTELRIDGGSAVETDFSEADLQRATICNVDLRGAMFNDTDLRDTHLEGSVDYLIDPRINRLDRCSVSLPGAASFLTALGLELVDPPEPAGPSGRPSQ